MTIVAILVLLWLLPTLIFLCAAMLAIPGTMVRRGARRIAGASPATAKATELGR